MSKRWTAMLLASLVVVNVVLVTWAYRSLQSVPSGEAATVQVSPPAEQATTEPDEDPEPAATEQNDESADTPDLPEAFPVLAPIGADEAFRVAAVECPGTGSTLEFTSDGGQTWSSTDAPELVAAQRMLAPDTSRVTLVGLDGTGCEPAALQSFVAGADWEPVEELGGYWLIDDDQVLVPSGTGTEPCQETPAQLAALDNSTAFVLCADRTLMATTDAAAWSEAATADAALAIGADAGASSPAVLIAAAGSGECDGIAIQRVTTSGNETEELGCADTDAGSDAVAVGGASDGTLWLWAGDEVLRSTDDGASWQ